MGRGSYHCRTCGAQAPPGARWCPTCHGTSLEWVEPEAEAGVVVPLGPTRVLDGRELWPDAKGPPPISPTIPVARESIPLPERSRWKRGATTFGPGVKIAITLAYACYLIWGFFNEFFISYFVFAGVGAFIVFKVWSRAEVDRSPPLFRRSIEETRDSFKRSFEERKAPAPAGPRCRKCGASRRAEERRCYRCGGNVWVADVADHVVLCGRCHLPWVEGTRWCQNCGAGDSAAITVGPAAPSPEVIVVKRPTPIDDVTPKAKLTPAGFVSRVIATVALGLGLLSLFLVPNKAGALFFAPYLLVAGLLTWGMWHKAARW